MYGNTERAGACTSVLTSATTVNCRPSRINVCSGKIILWRSFVSLIRFFINAFSCIDRRQEWRWNEWCWHVVSGFCNTCTTCCNSYNVYSSIVLTLHKYCDTVVEDDFQLFKVFRIGQSIVSVAFLALFRTVRKLCPCVHLVRIVFNALMEYLEKKP